MSSASSSAATRRQQQNREAQRRRRQALKIKIEELKASNLELQAFKESHPRASRRGSAGSGLLSPKLRPPPDSSNGICQGSGSAPQDSAHQLLWDDENLAHMSTLHTCLPCLEKDFLNDLTINTNVNFDSADTNATADTRFRQYPPSNSESESVGEAWEASQPPNGYWSRSRDSMGQITVLQLQSSDALDDLMNSRGREMAGLEKEPGITESRPSSAAARVARLDRSDKSQRAMKVAVTNRQTAMVKLLIHHGVSVNAQDESRRTVLHDATEANDAKTVQLLLENGADSNVVDASGMTALELAASLGNVEVAKVLLKEGAD